MANITHNDDGEAIGTPDPAVDSSPGERAWVKTLEPRITAILADVETADCRAEVCTSYRLPYTCEILRYEDDSDTPVPPKSQLYETDLLIYDVLKDGSGWIPRVVIECKLGGVTTHDALTYSTKAATHKHVHPYLRYGILIGAHGRPLPPRLIRHGAYFDFMTAWQGSEPQEDEWSMLRNVLIEEIRSGRVLQEVLTQSRGGSKKYRMLHRHLSWVEARELT